MLQGRWLLLLLLAVMDLVGSMNMVLLLVVGFGIGMLHPTVILYILCMFLLASMIWCLWWLLRFY